MRVSSAGNTEVPAYLVLIKKGFDVSNKNERWIAHNEQHELSADGLLELLGLVTMCEERGEDWRATDNQTDAFLRKYDLD